MEEFKVIDKKETAKNQIIDLESEFQKLSKEKIPEREFYYRRSIIDAKFSKIYDEFPDLEEWNENR